MVTVGFPSSGCIYVCTRFRVRKTLLYPREEYTRFLNRSIPEIAHFLSKGDYGEEITLLARTLSGTDLIEAALNRNLARTFQSALQISQGDLHTLVSRYLNRWDISNVMAIFRGIEHDIPREQIQEYIVPAGEIPPAHIEHLLTLPTCDRVAEELESWVLAPVIAEHYRSCEEKGALARLENELYKQYYADLLADIRHGVRGGDVVTRYLRFEIDITNMKNLMRLRCGKGACDIRTVQRSMIPGGETPIEVFQRMYGMERREEFINAFKQTDILPILTRALREVRGDESLDQEAAAQRVWERWHARRRAGHEIEVAITRVRLHRMDRMARRHAFSALPILSYLEHKRYEVGNLRAIARGKEFDLPPERIRRYLVL
ncbi:ATP synthase subunit C [Methanoculleus taiwanensis]|uniref:A-type ATP synthase subunit C n=1 Tax=Methanoculleus taiwanensis TaxID=1550565 RepID=A0A498H3Q5_9EURY|nr:ATP synthase subunit C [Methanoculleus taiwanensis]